MNTYIETGTEGLDYILNGGFPVDSSILLEGAPGTGKTILGMQFLYHGAVNRNESGIYITFEEMPDQIYKEMQAFGWDIKKLEKENKLRVICMSPEVLLQQMKKPNGILEQIIKEIDCKRIVVDSLNLLHYGIDDQLKKRQSVYTLRNIFRKYEITSLLINEQMNRNDSEIPFSSYVVDGVIKLALEEQNTIYRKRTLEVLKMRGCRIQEGEHIYRITDSGMYLVPALSMFEDLAVTENQNNIPTGIPGLDNMLAGGIPRGTTFVLDTNSKANYKYITTSIIISRILAGEKVIMLMGSSMTYMELDHIFQLYGIELKQLVTNEEIYFIEHYDRYIPEGIQPAIIRVENLSNEEYKKVFRERLDNLVLDTIDNGQRWFIFYDLNTIVSLQGKDFINSYYTEITALINSWEMSMIALSNFTEIGKETSSFLERTSNGVFQTWVDGNYQYFQLKKSPQGNMSQPMLVENIPSKPFIRLV
ncbi:ATPase domain-containing protein [Desertibacillus haloalkaliphilus]|uniref:ATPase domain-containing protein n=1 Tax=Desertibacillus haloalkaliphilus TaxID=1328930 RepID=UPI001C27365C|nr:ATPase domain-containing protein [Desertibacillus haloalkaliphilus]MBU8906281.1 circadian clock protein KaiC [Desertibacillus haloalkaliphilus]